METQEVKCLALVSSLVIGSETSMWEPRLLTVFTWRPRVITGALSLLPHSHGQSKSHSPPRFKAGEAGSTSW